MGTALDLLTTRCSLVICLIDALTGLAPGGAVVTVKLDGEEHRAIRKPGGQIVYADLQNRCYSVSIHSNVYHERHIEVDLSLLPRGNPVVYIQLMPNAQYRFPSGTTVLRTAVYDSTHRPLGHAEVRATVGSEIAARAKLAVEHTPAGANVLGLNGYMGKLAPGDRYLLRERSGRHGELCTVTEHVDHERSCVVDQPLSSAYSRGSLLLPVIESVSDSKGQVVLAIRPFLPRSFDIKLELRFGTASVVRDVTLQEGADNKLDPVILPT